MNFAETAIAGCFVVTLAPHGDERGRFARTMCRDAFAAHGLIGDFVQQNMSVTAEAGTVRGLHFQRPPHAEAKLVRCVRGAVLDVVVDLREGEPTRLHSIQVELSAENQRQIYIPPGCAHGFQTLVDDVEMTYLMSAAYAPEAESGLRHDDPVLAIDWPLPVSQLSARDAAFPLIDRDHPPAL
ncbi:MAG: dTDP-4-dehydrorhamnose 3,5-epimerase [Sphingomonas sp.]